MTAAPDISEDERGLDALAQIDLRLAQVFAARAEAAEDPEVANGLVRSYQRAARSYRQSLALRATDVDGLFELCYRRHVLAQVDLRQDSVKPVLNVPEQVSPLSPV